MSRNKLVIFESPDGLGKTTMSKRLSYDIGAKYMFQPSLGGLVDFRSIAFNNDNGLTALERQLFLAMSHTVDAYRDIHGFNGSIVLDRCFISGAIYGENDKDFTDRDYSQLMLPLLGALSRIYRSVCSDFDVYLIFLTARERFNVTSDDRFEKNIKWANLRDGYNRFYRAYVETDIGLFSESEKSIKIDVTGLSENDVYGRITGFISD